MAKSFGNTWWGEKWLNSLTHIDYENRIPRGAAYARKEMVRELTIKGNQIKAKVAGSRPHPYSITIDVPPFTPEQVQEFVDKIIQYPILISRLLNRELAPSLLDLATLVGLNVFPLSWKDLQMKCSCPDWAVPCKHLAAVIYTMSKEIDNNPFLVFSMHNLDLVEELKKRGLQLSAKENMTPPAVETLFEEKALSEINRNYPPFCKIDFSHLQNIAEPLIGLLPENPAFCNSGDFRAKYRSELLCIVKNAQKLLNGKISPTAFFPPFTSLTHRSDLRLSLDDNFSIQLLPSLDPEQKLPDKETEQNANYRVDTLTAALFAIHPDMLPDYQPSIGVLHQALLTATQLLANGAVIPQIVMLSNGNFVIRWLPAIPDDATNNVLRQLSRILPDGLLEVHTGKHKTPFSPANATEWIVSFFLNVLIRKLSRLQAGEPLPEMFFKSMALPLTGIGEKGTAGGIKAWTDRYYIKTGKYRPVFKVEEEANGFALHVYLEDMTANEQEAIPLDRILAGKEYAQELFGILKKLSMLSGLVRGLDKYINDGGRSPILFDTGNFASFLLQTIPAIRLLNVKVILPKSLQQLLRPKTSLQISKRSNDSQSFIRLDDLLTFDWRIAVGDDILTATDFEQLLQKASGLIRFKENYIYVSEEDLARLHKVLTEVPKLSPGQLLQAALTGEYETSPIGLLPEAKELIEQLTRQEEIPLPTNLHAQLRPYQLRGYSWMYRNMRIGFGSIIADDMGLGKTLQVITLLQKVKEEGGLVKKKALIVVPTGLLTNWQAEIARFTPSLSVFTYHGTSRELKNFNRDILLTTYGVLRSDATLLKKLKWQVMVIDEAQNIKNHDTVQSKAVRSIPAETHIAMSGTPVENRLSEFWSIMDFANKGYLDTVQNFNTHYAKPIQINGDRSTISKFRKVTAPFMIRRLKSDKSIITDLPDKIEQNEYASLTCQQAALYQETLQTALSEIASIEGEDHRSLFERQGLVLQMILALKQICNHPAQFLKNGDADPSLSGKTEMLLDLVDSITQSNEKTLIFTQFKEMGDLLQLFISQRTGERPMFLHGGCSIKERQRMVERFQNNRADKVFILSLKAAGTGLNLTAASHVIHYDLWWNPAVEAQATDRAYRIGQHSNIQVHRFITKDTFEEKIDRMIRQKKTLAELTVTSGESWIGKLSNKELEELFG